MGAVLRIVPLRRLWYAQVVSVFGDFLALYAVMTIVTYKLHATPQQVTGIQIAYLAPIAVLGIISGVFADRWPVKLTLVSSDLTRARALPPASTRAFHGGILRRARFDKRCFQLLLARARHRDSFRRAVPRPALRHRTHAAGDVHHAHHRRPYRRHDRHRARRARLLHRRFHQLRRIRFAHCLDCADHPCTCCGRARSNRRRSERAHRHTPHHRRHARRHQLHPSSRRSSSSSSPRSRPACSRWAVSPP